MYPKMKSTNPKLQIKNLPQKFRLFIKNLGFLDLGNLGFRQIKFLIQFDLRRCLNMKYLKWSIAEPKYNIVLQLSHYLKYRVDKISLDNKYLVFEYGSSLERGI